MSTKSRRSPVKAVAEVPPLDGEAGNVKLSLRESQKLLTRERLLDAAMEVFERESFRAATIDQIAQAAAVNRATLYLHYKDKFAIAKGLAMRAVAMTDERLYSLLVEQYTSLAQVRKVLRSIFALHRQHATLFNANHIAMYGNRDLLQLHRTIVRKAVALGDRGLDAKQKAQLERRFLLLYYMYDRVYYLLNSLDAQGTLDAESESLLDTVADFWWHMVLKPNPEGLVPVAQK